jgi:hypothetical protein
MGVRFPSVAVTGVGNALPASSAETVVYTTPPINEPIDNAQVMLFWSYTLLAGTGTTAVTFKLRRGLLVTSPLIHVNNFSNPLAAAANGIFAGCYADNPGIVAGVQYSLTIVQTGATANGVNADGCLIAMVL